MFIVLKLTIMNPSSISPFACSLDFEEKFVHIPQKKLSIYCIYKVTEFV